MALLPPHYLDYLLLCEDCRKKAKLEPMLTIKDILDQRRIKPLCPKCQEKATKSWLWAIM